MKFLRSILTAMFIAILATSAFAHSPFVVEYVSSEGYPSIVSMDESPRGYMYQDPRAVLGKPHALNPGWGPCPAGPVSMIEPSFATDTRTGSRKITTIRKDQEIVIAFDHIVKDDPENPYGIDFIVFGNPMFSYGGYANIPYVKPIMDNTSVFAEPVTVSVSLDGKTWYTYENGPYGDDLFPTQAVKMLPDGNFRNSKGMYLEKNFTYPVDPAFTYDMFGGITVYEADSKLYGISAGGTGFDLKESGLSEIKYIKLTSDGGEIDAISDVDPLLEDDYLIPVNSTSTDLTPEEVSFVWNVPKEAVGEVTYHLNLYAEGGAPIVSDVVSGSSEVKCTFKDLKAHKDYHLYITASYADVDDNKVEKTGLWQFFTKNNAPKLEKVLPLNGSKNVPVNGNLTVSVSDLDGDSISQAMFKIWSSDVVLNSPEICADAEIGLSNPSEISVNLAKDISLAIKADTEYFWKVIASDDFGGSLESKVFRFRTAKAGVEEVSGVKVSGDMGDVISSIILVSETDEKNLGKAVSLDITLQRNATSMDVASCKVNDLDADFEELNADKVLKEACRFDVELTDGANSTIVPISLSFDDDDFTALGLNSCDISEENILDKIHVVKIVKDKAFDLVSLADYDRDNIFEVGSVVSSDVYTVAFNLLIVDSASADVSYVSDEDNNYIVVLDGEKDGHAIDPITAMTSKSASTSGGGGCSVGFSPAALLLLIPVLSFIKR